MTMEDGVRVGTVSHYFTKIGVAVLALSESVNIGDRLHFLGKHTDFPQQIGSMQVEHEPVEQAGKGSEVAIKVDQRVRRGDSVFRLTE
jgi:isopentenyl diphosphate isomerase/L-lactate dehydrogenase-like FMN-dependent dehydrogenase